MCSLFAVLCQCFSVVLALSSTALLLLWLLFVFFRKRFMCDMIRRSLKHPDHPTAFLSGPSFARELMDGQATGLVVASDNEQLAQTIQSMLGSDAVRVYTSPDVVGVEVGGAIKNVFAIACGMRSGIDCVDSGSCDWYHHSSLGCCVQVRNCQELLRSLECEERSSKDLLFLKI